MGRVKPTNRKRRAKSFARNFGDRAELVREMGCVAGRAVFREWRTPVPSERCEGPIQAAHATARGMGGRKGSRRDLTGLCAGHHHEAGERGTSQRESFDEKYGGRAGWLESEANRIAAELDALGVDMPDEFEDVVDDDGHGYEVMSLELGVHDKVVGWSTQADARAAAWGRWAELRSS